MKASSGTVRGVAEQRSGGGLPRAFDAMAAAAGLLVTLPFLLVIAITVRLTSPGPALFRQIRVGRGGQPFEMLKFRTMRDRAAVSESSRAESGNDEPDSTVTVGGDRRVTPIGSLLRRTKLDELPELINVLRGDMALVGPRPEVPDYVDTADATWRRVLERRPGLTSETSLLLRAEEEVLRLGLQRTGFDTDRFYRQHLLPFKLRHSIEHEARRSVWRDLRTLFATVGALVRAPERAENLLDRILRESSGPEATSSAISE